MKKHFSLMIHGGAGSLDRMENKAQAARYLKSIRTVLEHGREILSRGGSAMEAVEVCTSLLEDDPLYNAGCGSVLNENGKVEMDAAIMDGHDLSAGAVAGISNIANPVQLARLVIANSEHVMLIGAGALHFAEHCGMELMPDGYFLTDQRIEQLKQAKRSHRMMLDHDSETEGIDNNLGTVGAVAYDINGNLAAATSTGGLVNKRWGRVGDSPVIGCGVYADNETCAVSTTGYGEDFLRTVLAKTISDYVELRGMNAMDAAQAGIEYLQRKVNGLGGVIVIDRYGNCAKAYCTKRMIHGWIEKGGVTNCGF